MRSRPLRWYEAVGVTLLGALAGAVAMAHILGGPKWLVDIEGQTWAGWVQALGSIAAIIGAAKLADRGRKEGQEDRRRDLLLKEVKATKRVLAAAELAANRIGALRLLLSAEPSKPRTDSIEKVKNCLEMLKTALEWLDEAEDIWALGQQFLQQVAQVVRTADLVLQSPLPTPDHLNDGSWAANRKGVERRTKAEYAIQSCSVALQTAGEICDSCRAFIERPSITELG